LAGGVAHEFNNLLTIIYGRSQLLRGRVGTDPRLLRDVDDIDRAAQRAAALTEQLLAFGQQQALHPHLLDLNQLLVNLRPRLQELLGGRINLECVFDPTIPQIQADARQIQRLFVDLVRHAREAMPDGGRLLLETTHVELDGAFLQTHPSAQAGRYVRVSVLDNGAGMDDTIRRRVFEPFFTAQAGDGDVGIGLAVTYGIVKQHGGYISVEGHPDGGTMFRIYLPVPEQAEERSASGSQDVLRTPTRATVLLVDDEPTLRSLASEILERGGYSVMEASDGDQALELAARHAGPIHVLLTDVMMPHMRGSALADSLARTHPGLRVVYMSGFAGDVIDRVSQPGARFLPKPFTAERLLQEVGAALAG
jgi:CheY-like chemotaxis protein